MPRPRFDPRQEPIRPPGSEHEYIRTRDGTRHIARTWDAVTREWQYTDIGKQFFADKKVEYIARIPVVIEGNRRDRGGVYKKRTHLPVEMLGQGKIFVGAMLSSRDASDAAKHQVLEHIGIRSDSTDEKYIIYEFSDEKYVYDPRGTWYISAMTTERTRDGRIAAAYVFEFDPAGPQTRWQWILKDGERRGRFAVRPFDEYRLGSAAAGSDGDGDGANPLSQI